MREAGWSAEDPDRAQLRQARQLREGRESMLDVCAALGVARSKLYRALAKEPAA